MHKYIYHNSVSLYNAHSYLFQHLYVILREFNVCALLTLRGTNVKLPEDDIQMLKQVGVYII
jgi:hypothetical protein